MSIADSFVAAYKKCSLITKLIGGFLILFYALSFFKESKKLLAITPGYFMPPNYYVWTLFTFIFYDDHWYCVIIDIVTLFFSNTLLEPLWGQRELMKYLLIVTVMSGLMCFFLCYFLYLFTYSLQIIFNTHIHGMIAYAAAITVAVRQTLPDDIILSLPIANIKNQHLSFICMLIVICMTLLHLVNFVYCFLFISGILVSWTYLRFYQKHGNGHHGDHSDSFEFARFFPNHLVPPVSIVANAIFSLLVRIRLCKKFERQLTEQPHQQPQSSPGHKTLSSSELRQLPVPDFRPQAVAATAAAAAVVASSTPTAAKLPQSSKPDAAGGGSSSTA
uniref:Transmembrane protein 115 n=1 Tax=Macrostomum lignano TaxID=282301 RepID=A0A1I8HJI4_9PLAT